MRSRSARRVILLAVLLGVGGGVPRTVRAGGFAIPEIGARRTGMAAVVGRPDDLSAIYHNPAGLTLLQGTQVYLSMGLALLGTEFKLRPWAESDRFIDAPVDAAGFYPETRPSRAFGVIPMLAVSTNLWTDKVVAAAALYVPNAQGAAFPREGVTRYHLIDSYAVAGFGGLSVAYQPVPWFSFGAGVSLIYVKAHAQRLVFPILNGQDESALLGARSELTLDGQGFAPGWNAGVLLWPHRRVSLALVAISRSTIDVEGPINVRLSDTTLELPGRQQTGVLIPWTVMAGANCDVTRFLEVGFELRYWFYSELKNQHTEVTGLEPLLSVLDSPRNYSDSYQVSGGVRVHSLVRGLDTMLGMHYDHVPAPNSTVSFDAPSFFHYGLHLGVRYTFKERYRLGLTYVRYWYLQRDVTDSVTLPPSNFRGSGSNNIITFTVEALLGRGLGMRAAPQGAR